MIRSFSFRMFDGPKLATLLLISLLVTSGFAFFATADQNDEKITGSNAVLNSMTWDVETVDDQGNVGSSSSMVVDSTGSPHLSYFDDDNGATKYAVKQQDSWHTETINNSKGVSSIAVDGDDVPHVCFSSEVGELRYGNRSDGSWGMETVDSGSMYSEVGTIVSMEMDKNGNPHIAYVEYFPMEGNFTLKYAHRDGSSWNIDVVDDNGDVYYEQFSLALDSDSNAHISFYDRDPSTGEVSGLKYAKYTGSSWENETVVSGGDVGDYCSIDIDSQDDPHIVYYDRENYLIKYAEWTGSSWDIGQIYDNQANDLSLALGSGDKPHVSFYDLDSINLKYANRTDSSWSLETVDSDGTVGKSSSLALDSEEKIHIGYYDFDNDALKYAKESEGTDVTAPSAPENVDAYGKDGEVDLDWDAPSDDGGSSITGYNIYRGTSSGSLSQYQTVDGSTTTYTDTDVTNEQTYYYSISAENTAGEGDRSGEVSATPSSGGDTTTPTADAGEDKTVEVGEQFTLNASGSSDNVGIDSYQWDLGNGDTDTGEEITYTYDEKGTYDVELTVTDGSGNTDTDTVTITVEEDTTDDGGTDGDDDGGSLIPGFTVSLIIFSCIIALAIYTIKKE